MFKKPSESKDVGKTSSTRVETRLVLAYLFFSGVRKSPEHETGEHVGSNRDQTDSQRFPNGVVIRFLKMTTTLDNL